MKDATRCGFSLLETVISTSVLVLVVTAAMGSWLLFMNKSNRVNTQANLDLDVRKVVERFRAEMRNASRETIMFYPDNQPPYEGVGFALASDTDGDGLMDMDASGSNILWRQTVIYHVWRQAPTQMRRTVFDNRNGSATIADRYGQMKSVVASGNGSTACLDGERYTTSVMFENLFTGRLWHAEATFDGYAPDPNTLDRITFGSTALGPGAHKVNFTVQGKNPSSTGRAFRIDQIAAGVSGWPLEAELCTVNGFSAAPLFVGPGLSGAAYGLNAPTAADGDSLSLTVYNDAIEECAFIGKGRNVSLSNTVVRFDATLKPTGFSDGVYVTRLGGQFTNAWWGSEQAFNADSGGRDFDGSLDIRYIPGTNCSIRIPIQGSFVRQDGCGPVFYMYKSYYNINLKIFDPCYAPTGTPGSPDIDDLYDLTPLEFYQEGYKKSSWAACAVGGVELRPAVGKFVSIVAGKSYIFSYRMAVSTPDEDSIRAFQITKDSEWGCWILKGENAATVTQRVWSSSADLDYVKGKNSASFWKRCLPGLVNMTVNYAEGGEYVSHPFDTRSGAGAAKTFAWDADVPRGAALRLYVRSGDTLSSDGFDISDALPWASVSPAVNGSVLSGVSGRYMQFRAEFESSKYTDFYGRSGTVGLGPYRSATPRLRRALFTWDGETKYVDIVGNLLKGPNNGIVRVDVDGKPLVKGVSMEIEIYKDVMTQGAKTERIKSAMMTEIEPRNTNK